MRVQRGRTLGCGQVWVHMFVPTTKQRTTKQAPPMDHLGQMPPKKKPEQTHLVVQSGRVAGCSHWVGLGPAVGAVCHLAQVVHTAG